MSTNANAFALDQKSVLVRTNLAASQLREAACLAHDHSMPELCRDLHQAAHAVEAAIVKARRAARGGDDVA